MSDELEIQPEEPGTAAKVALPEKTGKKLSEIAAEKSAQTRRSIPKPPPLQKVDEGQRERTFAAAMALRDQKQKQIAENVKPKTEMGYVECRVCLGVAIWIHGDSSGLIAHKDWEAAYKPKGADWGGARVPHCQCCAASGVLQPAMVMNHGIAGIGIMANYYRAISRDEFERLTSPEGRE